MGAALHSRSPSIPRRRDGLKAVMNDLVDRYPDRSDVKCYLFSRPDRTYVLYAVFDTGAGPGAL
jgi:hypothetical protein